jgi:hypothetical protein
VAIGRSDVMRGLLLAVWIGASAPIDAAPRALVLAESEGSAQQGAVRAALTLGGRYAATVLIDDAGRARGDYDQVRGEWLSYEPAWHTGQLIWGLLEAERITGERAFTVAARRGGEWWRTQVLESPPGLAGMLNAAHGGPHGSLINFSTLSDGTPGLFALSRATGDRRYADAATRAGAWTLQHLYRADVGLVYNIVDPTSGAVWTDRSPHHPNANPATPTQVARPNIEGFLYLDMYRHSGDRAHREAFLTLAESALKRQDRHGLWLDFEPNDPTTGKIHPRFNIWYAEALLEAHAETGDARFLDAAERTGRTMAKLQRDDGTIHYDAKIDSSGALSVRERSLTGSATAFAGLLWLRLRDHGRDGFEPHIERSRRWLLANQFPAQHPDPNLRGGFLETWVKREGDATRIQVRAIATAFALRFLAAYHDRCCAASATPGALIAERAASPSSAETPRREASEFTPNESTPSITPSPAPLALRGTMAQAPGHLLARSRVDLSGRWRHIVDPFDLGRRKPHAVRRNLPLDLVAVPGGELIEYDWDQAAQIDVPADWNTAIPALEWYEGVVWYRTRFDAPAQAGRHVLYFEGANYRTEVWVNGVKLGAHDGGFTPFAFALGAELKPRDNSLVIAVDNARRA